MDKISLVEAIDALRADLTRAALRLGRKDEARDLALPSLRQAWGDGPPHCDHWYLREVRRLLALLDIEEPSLPKLNPARVVLPFEPEVLTFIKSLSRNDR